MTEREEIKQNIFNQGYIYLIFNNYYDTDIGRSYCDFMATCLNEETVDSFIEDNTNIISEFEVVPDFEIIKINITSDFEYYEPIQSASNINKTIVNLDDILDLLYTN
jgi:hypothetical protein